MRRIRVSTPRELASLRKIDPEKAKPFTFAVSPILMENPHAPNQVLIGASLDPEDWQAQDYVDADTGKIFKLAIPWKDDDPHQPYPRT